MNLPRLAGLTLAVCSALAMTFGICPSGAQAAQTRLAASSFGPDGVGGTEQFETIQAVATEPATGAIYVLDQGPNTEGGRLYKFDAAGTPSNFSGLGRNYIKGIGAQQFGAPPVNQIAIAPAGAAGGTAGDIYVARFSTVKIYSPAGLELGELTGDEEIGRRACGVTTNAEGHVFVAFYNSSRGQIREYTPTGNPPTNSDQSSEVLDNSVNRLCNLADDSNHHFYAAQILANYTAYFATLASVPVTTEPGGSSVAVDPQTDEVYLDTGSTIRVREPADGGPNGSFGSAGLAESRSVAVSPDGADVYVANGATGKVEIYGAPLAVPNVEVGNVSSVTDTQAVLTGTINPESPLPAQCEFDYVSESNYLVSGFAQAISVPCVPAGPFEGSSAFPVSAAISGLSRVSTYYVRLRGVNANGGNESVAKSFTTAPSPFAPPPTFGPCPSNEVFRVGPSASLPDCRAYEQASPTDKNGGGVEAELGAIQATQSGDAVTFFSQAGFPGGVGAQDYPTYLASRGDDSWSTQGLLPPQALGEFGEYLGLTPSGRFAIAEAGLERREAAVIETDLSDGSVTIAVPYTECEYITCFEFAGASADGSKVFLETKLPLTGETPEGQPNLFVWDRDSGQIRLVDVRNPGESASQPVPLSVGGFAGPYDWEDADLSQGGVADRMYVGAINAISPDGSQVVFTERGEGGGQLYLRENPGMPQSPIGAGGKCIVAADACTVHVSAPTAGAPPATQRPAAFLEATPDGRYIFFKSKQELTEDAYAGIEGESWSLYRYDVSTGNLVDLTPDPTHTQEVGPGVIGMLGSGEGGGSAYFAAEAALTTAPGPAGSLPVKGEANLYHYEEGADPPLSFVATLKLNSAQGYPSTDYGDWSPRDDTGITFLYTYAKTSRVSADGQSIVFSSHRALTGALNLEQGCNTGHAAGRALEPCAEFFRYSAAAGTLDCLSCDPTGAAPRGSATIGASWFNIGDATATWPAPVLSRNLSADGDRFFFQTPDSLVGTDANARSGCTFTNEESAPCGDVYEWEAPGTGSCAEASSAYSSQNGGCLYLVSSGQDEQASLFADADREGKNAFIITASQLVPPDRDQLYDVYDVREGGGLASQHEASLVPCASQQACQGPLKGSEVQITSGSSSFTGSGNPKPKTCKKGFIHKHGKCVKKPKHHKKRHKQHRKGQKSKKAKTRRTAGHGRGGRK
jgi:hypothetical protein